VAIVGLGPLISCPRVDQRGNDLPRAIANSDGTAVCFGLNDASLDQAVVWDDLATFDDRPWRGVVDIVAAGFRRQPLSAAGKYRAADDPRDLWPHVAASSPRSIGRSSFSRRSPIISAPASAVPLAHAAGEIGERAEIIVQLHLPDDADLVGSGLDLVGFAGLAMVPVIY
jgi:hypothetical protein